MEITFQGDSVTLSGNAKTIGDKYEDVTLQDTNNNDVRLSDHISGLTIISVIPDITTRVCELQTKHFIKNLQEKDYSLITVSRNTPEQLKAWASENELELVALSDGNKEFGRAYGVEMEAMDKLARSVFVIDGEGMIQYIELVPEMTDEPNYDKAIEAAENL